MAMPGIKYKSDGKGQWKTPKHTDSLNVKGWGDLESA